MASSIAPTGIARTSITAATITAATFHAPPPFAGRAGSSRGMACPLPKASRTCRWLSTTSAQIPIGRPIRLPGRNQNRQNAARDGQAVRLEPLHLQPRNQHDAAQHQRRERHQQQMELTRTPAAAHHEHRNEQDQGNRHPVKDGGDDQPGRRAFDLPPGALGPTGSNRRRNPARPGSDFAPPPSVRAIVSTSVFTWLACW